MINDESIEHLYLCTDHLNKINIKFNIAMKLVQKYMIQNSNDPLKVIPKEYHSYLNIFSEEKVKHFLPPQKWNHHIDLLPTFKPKAFPNYKLAPKGMEELDKFLDENLEKGFIHPLKSPMASPFFFIGKKDQKLQPCQDLNTHM
ncbi:hypothetical protein AN958_12606 [Leucoagaricus sp. SymC.cos]|nr:hypothetical protein AN958_12606 [Leucoagaricus sp. SymC.cos]